MNSHAKHRPDFEAQDSAAIRERFTNDLKQILTSSSIVVDVGANRGQFAKEVLECVPVSAIYAFEPVPEAFHDLQKEAANRTAIKPIQMAVDKSTGKTHINVTMSDVGSSLLEPLPMQSSQWLTPCSKLMVKTTRLDDFLRTLLLTDDQPVSLLKSDAQGYDLSVLTSAGEFLRPEYIRAVLVELNFAHFYSGQEKYHEVLALLDSKGYRLAWIYPHRAYDQWLWWADALFIGKQQVERA